MLRDWKREARGTAASRNMRVWVIAGALVFVVAGAALMRRAASANEGGRLVRSEISATVAKEKPSAQARPEFKSFVRVFVHPDDIYPIVATAPPGKVVIAAENNAGKDIAVVVEPAGNPGKAIARVPTIYRDKRNSQEFTLAAGEYVFYEESRPKRHGRLIISEKFR